MQNSGEKRVDIEAQAVCPKCGRTHTISVLPDDKVKLHKRLPGNANYLVTWRTATLRERAENFYFRQICDACCAARAPEWLKAQLRQKGWDV